MTFGGHRLILGFSIPRVLHDLVQGQPLFAVDLQNVDQKIFQIIAHFHVARKVQGWKLLFVVEREILNALAYIHRPQFFAYRVKHVDGFLDCVGDLVDKFGNLREKEYVKGYT